VQGALRNIRPLWSSHGRAESRSTFPVRLGK
jgi:hypothetical protein